MKTSRNAGFTLIEIVMVLVLLGILAAVAVPKYFDLQEKAEIQAAKAIVAEVQARVNGEFANAILADQGTCTKAREAAVKVLVGSPDSSGNTASSEIAVTGGYTITASVKGADADIYEVVVNRADKSQIAYTGEVSVPVCAKNQASNP